MDLKKIIEQKRAAAAEERLRKKNLQALEQAAVEDRDRQEKEREELELAREIQNENKPVAPLSFGGIIAKKRKRPGISQIVRIRIASDYPLESENPPSHALFVDTAASDPPRPPKKSKLSEPPSDTESLLSSRQESHTPKSPTKNPYAPERKPRSKTKALYQYQEVVDTRATPSEWYLNTNMNQKYGRSDLQTISYVKTIIKNCIDAVKNDGQPERYISELRTKLHEMEFYEFLSGVLIKRSKVLESEGLLQMFDGPDKDVFPWDLAADAEALWLRWMGGDLDSSLLRGISTTKGILQSGMKRTSHKLEKDYMQKKSANVIGVNNLVNGQWWPSRICALRDGAHGEQEAGIHGQTGVGAFSVVVAAGGYADKDHGEVCFPVTLSV